MWDTRLEGTVTTPSICDLYTFSRGDARFSQWPCDANCKCERCTSLGCLECMKGQENYQYFMMAEK